MIRGFTCILRANKLKSNQHCEGNIVEDDVRRPQPGGAPLGTFITLGGGKPEQYFTFMGR